MKKIILLILVTISLTSSAQQVDISHSFNRQTGLNIYNVTKSGFIWGIGGSYLFSTYTGETRYQELANTILGNDGNRLPLSFRLNNIKRNFIEDRGTVKALLGKSFGRTSIYASLGLAFRSEYWVGEGYDFLPGFTSPDRNFYIYKNISPRPLIGFNVLHLVNNRWGMNAGYETVSGFTYGITINLKGLGLFQH